MTFFSCLFQVACTASEEDMARNNIELKWLVRRKLYSRSGDVIEFQCKKGYLQDPASPPFRAQCVEGTLDYPRCKPGSKSSPLWPQLSCCVVAFLVLKTMGNPLAFLGKHLGKSQGVGGSCKLQALKGSALRKLFIGIPELERLLGKGLSGAGTNSLKERRLSSVRSTGK